MTISVILVTFVSLTFVGAAALLQMQIGKMKDDWYDKVEVSVFLCPQDSRGARPAPSGEVTDDQKADIEAALDVARRSSRTSRQSTPSPRRRRSTAFQEQFKDQCVGGGRRPSTT